MENKTAQQIAGGIPCACSDCGMNEVAYKERLKKHILSEYDWTNEALINMIDTL